MWCLMKVPDVRVCNKLSADIVWDLFNKKKQNIIRSPEVSVSQFKQLWVVGMAGRPLCVNILPTVICFYKERDTLDGQKHVGN